MNPLIKSKLMHSVQKLLFLILVLSASSINADDVDPRWWETPIRYDNERVNDIEKAIIDAFTERDYKIIEKSPGVVVGHLENLKKHTLTLEALYDDSQVKFNMISFERTVCHRRRCYNNQSKYQDWRFFLRKSVSFHIHKQYLHNALQSKDIEQKWINTLKQGNIDERTAFARTLIDLEYYKDDVLLELQKQIEENYLRRLDGDEIRLYAYYCKALVKSKQEKFLPLLEQVKMNARAKKLKRFVRDYFVQYYGKEWKRI